MIEEKEQNDHMNKQIMNIVCLIPALHQVRPLRQVESLFTPSIKLS